jgi:hypothetical protein
MNKAFSCAVLAVSAALVGCGGGGGGGGADSGSGSTSGGGTAAPSTFDQVVPGTTMSWDTSRSGAFAVTVTNAAGTSAANAAVRVFTMTMVNPDDGTPLDEPVALDLIDTAVTDGSGQASFEVRLPDSLTEVLVVVTWDDQKAIRRVTLASNVTSLTVSTAL